MRLTEALLRRAEAALTFDPHEERRALLDRTTVAAADAATLRRRIAQALGEGSDAAQLAVDRLVSGGDHLNASYLERGMIAADAVARIEVRNGESELVGHATGFMVSPRLLLTNHHVLPTADDAAQSWLHFRYEYDALGRLLQPCVFGLEPSTLFFTDAELDITVVAVAPQTPDRRQRVSRFGWLRLSASADTIVPGEWLTMVHHPEGRPKQVALRQNLLINRTGGDLWYATETAPASSGAPVFNDSWQVVGVHRLGAPVRDRAGNVLTTDGEHWTADSDETRIVWRAGVATPAHEVLGALAAMHGEHPLIAQLLAESDTDAAEAIVVPLGSGADADTARGRMEQADDEAIAPVRGEREALIPISNGDGAHADHDGPEEALTVTVPLRITVRQSNGSGRAPALGVNLS
jgi:endonuclease G